MSNQESLAEMDTSSKESFVKSLKEVAVFGSKFRKIVFLCSIISSILFLCAIVVIVARQLTSKTENEATITLTTTTSISKETSTIISVVPTTTTYSLPEGCPYAGDGYCEDFYNKESCYFDGGDCCLDYINDDFCFECICHLDDTKHPSSTSTRSCPFDTLVNLVDDGYCDDIANTMECDYDGGDCCESNVLTYGCIDCFCHETGSVHNVTQVEDTATTEVPIGLHCFNIYNNYCNDNMNIKECNFDNGACCWPEIDSTYCSECICHEDGTRHPSLNNGPEGLGDPPCPNEQDGICDDENNNQICRFDGGDCCLHYIVDDYCYYCICHEDETRHPSAK